MAETLLVLAVLVAVLVGVLLVAALVRQRPRRSRPHDDTLRVGREEEVDGGDAALRSMGRNSWMRPGGGGV
ncbi:hypothetical protein [Kineococcus sp. SYSU DK003]|uniref:hypothetical protein n=1 Tax=Kineococcus sp. SYSU DK003 TaxID=3383124 RepID=UPI003D7CF5FE